MRPRLFTAALAVVASVVVAPSDARAQAKAQCVEADTAAQNERRAEHFRAAIEQLQVCSKPACPALVRADCTQRLNELEAIAPSVVFAAKDAAGDDVVGAHVTMDGAGPESEVGGAALSVDPGVHTFRFTADGASPVEKKLVIREGERGRQERVTFPDLHAAGHTAPLVPVVLAPITPQPSGSDASSSSWSGQKKAGVVAGGLGIVGVIVGSVMGGLSFSTWSSSQSECGPTSCTDRAKALSDHDGAVTDALVSDIGFIAGGVLVATGVVLYLTAPSRSNHSALYLVPSSIHSGGGVSLEGRF